jgi:hypothetical protein
VRAAPECAARKPAENGRSLKTQQRVVEVDVVLGELRHRTAKSAINGQNAYRSKSSGIP